MYREVLREGRMAMDIITEQIAQYETFAAERGRIWARDKAR